MVANRLKLAKYHCQNGNRQADVSRSRYVKAVSTLDANLSTMLKPDDWLKHFLNCNGPTHRALQQKEMNNHIGPTVKHEWNVTRHVLHYFLGYSETQQLTTWADPAFISFYMSYLSSREKENGIESAHEARPNKNETMAKVSISPEKRPNLFRENRSSWAFLI